MSVIFVPKNLDFWSVLKHSQRKTSPKSRVTWRVSRRINSVNVLKRSIRVDDGPVHYEVAGEGEPLVLVHGLSESTRVWYRNLPALAERYRVYLVDLPGFGAMRKFHRLFTLEGCAPWLDQWMEAVGIEMASLVGHSMGGYVCMSLAALRPQKIKRLVLVDSIGIP